MKKDNYTPNMYANLSPTQNLITFQHQPSPSESHLSHQHHRNNIPPQAHHHRYSHSIQQNPSNNAFTHLRNQISNLRTQFSKLIQKDLVGNPSGLNVIKQKDENRGIHNLHKEEKSSFFTTMYTPNGTAKDYDKKNQFFSTQKFKKQQSFHTNMEALEKDKRGNQTSQVNDKFTYPKKYSFQIPQGKQQNTHQTLLQKIRTDDGDRQIRKLLQTKAAMQKEISNLKRQVQKRQPYIKKANKLEEQNTFLKAQNEQNSISLSLKDSLVQKFQQQLSKNDKVIDHFKNLSIKKERQCDDLTLQLKKAGKRYSQQILKLQNVHNSNMNQVINKYTVEINHLNMLLFQHRKSMQVQNEYKQKSQFLQKEYHKIKEYLGQCQNNIYHLQNQIKVKDEHIGHLQYQLLEISKNIQVKQMDFNDKSRSIQEENVDLKKRVEFYKKTVEQLNNSNNSGREKILVHKQQLKKVRQQLKMKTEDLTLKQSLITSLYKDINILDSEIRHNSHSKNIIMNQTKSIDELNHIILNLQCQKLSTKYVEY